MHTKTDLKETEVNNTDFMDEEKQVGVQESLSTLTYEPEELKTNKRRPLKKIILIAACFIVFLLVVIGLVLGITLPLVLKESNPPASDESVRTSTEFQITIDSSLVKTYSRSKIIDSMMNYFSHKSYYFSRKYVEESTSTRKQYYLDSKGENKCGNDWEIRVREYLEDETCTIDIKGNSKSEQTAREMPFWPGSNYESEASQKCESDVHVCGGDKYSRETRIHLDSWKEWESCEDLVDFFPWAYDNLTSEQKNYTPKRKTSHYWFVNEYEGYLDGDTKIKVAITLEYDSLDELHDEHSKFSGSSEWSVRVFSLKDGLSTNYNEAVLEDMRQAWSSLANYLPDTC